MRRLPWCCILLAILAVTLEPGPLAAQSAKRPNILFIMSDDHGYQALSCYGSQVNQTPNLDRIANEGMRFDRCFVTNSICGPSRATILTGKYSHLNGFARNGDRFFGGQQHVGKLLQAAGYQTAVIGKWHLESDPTGFDYWRILIGQGPYYNPPIKSPDGVERMVGYTTDIITDMALDWLKTQRDPQQPFFLMYQHKAPHRNWMPGPKYLTKYDDVTIPEPPTLFDDYEGRGTAAKNQAMTIARHLNDNDLKLSPPRELNDEQRKLWDAAYGPKNEELRRLDPQGADRVRWNYQRYVKDYLRCVDAVDENVGRVLDYLDEAGLTENTLVIYTSDQGWYLGEHGWYDKRWMYEESFRTPLLMRWPGKIEPGSTNAALTMNLDFPETFLEAAGLEIPSDMQGRSLLPLFKGQQPDDWRTSVYYHYYEFPGAHSVAKHYGVRTDRYKLIHFYELDEWEMYDLEKDPHEMRSVYGDPAYADVLKQMQDELTRLRAHYRDDGTIIDFRAEQARETPLQLVQRFTPQRNDSEAAVVPGRRGPAWQLDGQSPVLTEPASNRLDPAYKPLTIAAWCRPADGDGVVLAMGGESLGFSLYLSEATPVFAVRARGQLRSVRGELLPLNEWSHVTAVLDAEGQASLLINGEASGEPQPVGLIPSRPADGLSLGADSGSLVGAYDSPLPFSGLLQDVRLYWGALPASDVRELVEK